MGCYGRFNLGKFIVSLFVLSIILPVSAKAATCSSDKFKKENVLVVGERAVSTMYRLKLAPEAWIGRKSFWEKAGNLEASSYFLSCPNGMVGPKKDKVKKAVKDLGIKRVIVAKSNVPCIFKPRLTSEKMINTIKEFGLKPVIIDFTKGADSALIEIGKFFQKEKEAEKLALFHKKVEKRFLGKMKKVKKGLKVLVLSGVYQETTGKSFVRVEVPGGYTDKFILNKVGAQNCAGSVFSKEEIMKADKGHIMVRGALLAKLLETRPDLVAATGDSFAVEQLLSKAEAKTGKKVGKLFSLPYYSDSDPLSYPYVINKWAIALIKAGI